MQRIFGRSPSSEAKVAGRSAASLPLSDHQSGGLISASASGYEVLLDNNTSGAGGAGGVAGGGASSSAARATVQRDYMLHQGSHRAWLTSSDAWGTRPSQRQRPPPRKLVKEPSRSARPSFSVELSDGGKHRRAWNSTRNSGANSGLYGPGADSKGIRQKVARWKELHWGGTGSSTTAAGPSVPAPP